MANKRIVIDYLVPAHDNINEQLATMEPTMKATIEALLMTCDDDQKQTINDSIGEALTLLKAGDKEGLCALVDKIAPAYTPMVRGMLTLMG